MPAASNALLSNLKKAYYCHRRWIENFCRLFSTQQRRNVFVSDAWPAPATHLSSQVTIKTNLLAELKHQAPITGRFVNTVTRGWSEPLTSAPSSDFMVQSLALSIDVCPGLGIPPLQTNIWLSFSQADLGPRSAQGFLGGFRKVWNFFFEDLCL